MLFQEIGHVVPGRYRAELTKKQKEPTFQNENSKVSAICSKYWLELFMRDD